MTRGLLIGLLVGALGGAVFGSLLTRSRLDPPPGPAPAPPRQVAPVSNATEADSLRAELKSARGQIESLKLELDAARKAAATAAAPAKAKHSWESLQARLGAGLKSGRLRSEDDPVTRELTIDMLTLLQDLAKEKGVTLAEALASPEGWPSLVAAFLEGAEPPLSAEQRGLLEKALASCRRDWDAFAARRGEFTGLEIIREADRLMDSFDDALKPALGKAHDRALNDVEELVEDVHPSRVLDFKGYDEPSDESLRRRWESEWGEVLLLRADQKGRLGPILDDYIRDQDALHMEENAAESSPQAGDRRDFRNRKIALMNAVQRRILEGLDLDAAQTAALRSWAIIYERDSP